jgi:hypothetical protein
VQCTLPVQCLFKVYASDEKKKKRRYRLTDIDGNTGSQGNTLKKYSSDLFEAVTHTVNVACFLDFHYLIPEIILTFKDLPCACNVRVS